MGVMSTSDKSVKFPEERPLFPLTPLAVRLLRAHDEAVGAVDIPDARGGIQKNAPAAKDLVRPQP